MTDEKPITNEQRSRRVGIDRAVEMSMGLTGAQKMEAIRLCERYLDMNASDREAARLAACELRRLADEYRDGNFGADQVEVFLRGRADMLIEVFCS